MNDVAYKTQLAKREMQDMIGTRRGNWLKRLAARLGRKLVRPRDVFGIVVKPFMDRYTYDQDRVSADAALMKEWLNGDKGHFYSLLKRGILRGNKIKKMDGGLDSIPEGLKYLQDGKVSAEKLAYTISQ